MHQASAEMGAILSTVGSIVQRSLKPSKEGFEIRPEMSLINDLDVDSLRMVDIVLDVEDHFEVRLLEPELQSVFTVGDLADLVAHKLKGE